MLWKDHKTGTQVLPDNGAMEPLKCEFPVIPFLGIHPKGIAMIVQKTVLCQRWRKRLSKSACAISRKHGATGLAAVTQSCEEASFHPLLPDLPRSVPPPRRHGFHPLPGALSLTQALAFPYAKP